jgi:putative tryptophan/tyrosine transport system substrate-binding protein
MSASAAAFTESGLLVGSSAFFNRRTGQLAGLAARHALPAIYPFREFALAGGLMSYGSSLGYFSTEPASIQAHSQRREKTAKALGTTFPTALLATADEVIE